MATTTEHSISFAVAGVPIPQGSMRHLGGHMVHSDPQLGLWRERIGWAALNSRPHQWPAASDAEVPFALQAQFSLVRPAYLPKRIELPIKKRDVDKLLRAVMDALTGVLWKDDGQVVRVCVQKQFAPEPGVAITVTHL